MTARSLMKTGSSGLVITISQAVRNPNIRSLAVNAGWNLTSPFTVIVDSGVDVADLRLYSQDFPHDVVTLINYGRIGGLGGLTAGGNANAGLSVSARVAVYNYGEIFGEGGRGGQGSTASCYYYQVSAANALTSSGTAYGGGQGFNRTAPLTGKTIPIANATDSEIPSWAYYTGALWPGTTAAQCIGGIGGRGGLIGQSGQAGSSDVSYAGTYVSPSSTPAGPGGICRAVTGNSFITWGNLGLIKGELV